MPTKKVTAGGLLKQAYGLFGKGEIKQTKLRYTKTYGI
jgi:hypothetical protein